MKLFGSIVKLLFFLERIKKVLRLFKISPSLRKTKRNKSKLERLAHRLLN